MTDDIHTWLEGVTLALASLAAFSISAAASWGVFLLGVIYTIVRIRYYLVATSAKKKEMRDGK